MVARCYRGAQARALWLGLLITTSSLLALRWWLDVCRRWASPRRTP